MQETYVWDKKNLYHYESFINDVKKRDEKRRELKAKWYKEISVWQYVCMTWDTVFFVKRK